MTALSTRGSRRGRPWGAALAVLALGAAMAPRAFAQRDPALAEALFQEGKRLMAEKSYDQACPKLAESQRLDPATGTLMALALCHDAVGKTASAWAAFSEVLAASRRDGRQDREKAAAERVAALEPRLSRLTIRVAPATAGLEIKRDGIAIGAAAWGSAMPVDPGEHHVEARAPGKKPWTAAVQVGKDGASVVVSVPALEDAPAAAASPGPRTPDAAPPATPQAPAGGEPPRAGGTQRTVGLVVGATGVVVLGVGAYFGLSARSQWKDAEAGHCTASHVCDREGVTLVDDAKRAATVSTLAFAVGAVAAVTGAVLWLTAAPRKGSGGPERTAHISPVGFEGGAGALLGGTF